ncbi:MAG: LptF/LptG family permease [Candidatus Protochlamydia sp.]|nr:LptF/LptG family permease [Candidatus Protochlamydia sp.]
MNIWKRYFLFEFLKVFFLFLGCFYTLYILIDYASHTSASANHSTQIHWSEIGRYYLFIFASRAEILIPVALLIAFVKTVTTMNMRQEIVALMAGGIDLRKLMRPFLYIGLAATGLLFLNEQMVLPHALKKLRRIEDSNKQKKTRHTPEMNVKHVVLENETVLLFQSYDTVKEQFFDVFWIESIDSLYRMKFLSPYTPIPTGYFVDHLVRQPDGKLLQESEYKTLAFNQIRFNPEILQSTILDPEALSLTQLAAQLTPLPINLNEKESKIMTAFYWKLFMPWLCLFAILAPAPFCLIFSRHTPLFFIYVCSLFGLIAFYMMMDAAQVIAKRQVLSPLLAIALPFLGFYSIFTWRYSKII